MAIHELREVFGGVLAASVFLEKLVEVLHHLVDRRAILVRGVFQCLLHAREALVEQLSAEQVLDLLIRLPRFTALPVVGRQLVDGRGRRGGKIIQLQLAEGAVVVIEVDVTGQLFALLQHRLVEEFAHLLEGAVEIVTSQHLPPLLGDPAGQVVQTLLVAPTATQQLPHRPLRAVAGHHVLADGGQCLGKVDGRRQRVAAVIALIARADAHP